VVDEEGAQLRWELWKGTREARGVLLRRKMTESLGMAPSGLKEPLSLLYASPIVPRFFNATHGAGMDPCRLLLATEM
jgi:hypothetical protein